MSTFEVHICQCPDCQQEADHPDREQHRLINLFLSRLNKQQRRLYVAIEAKRIGRGGGKLVSQITGMSTALICRGLRELDDYLASGVINRIQQSVGGRPRFEKTNPDVRPALEQMLDDEIAGNPMSEQKWVRSSTYQLAKRLNEAGHKVSRCTVWRMLREMGFSLKTCKKKIKPNSDSSAQNEQFQYIASQRQEFTTAGLPVVSVDTKKKELIGYFNTKGKTWRKKAEEVYAYDFPSLAECRAVPYGVYDIGRNEGFVYVGISADTPEFAVDAITRWWTSEGCAKYPGRSRLLILADSGGCNGCRVRGWKQQLQEKLSDKFGLTVTVCHYPTGCSKYNPVERRLFSQISINWAGKPLKSLDVMLGYIRGTSTRTGLKVKAFLQKGSYKRGQGVTKAEMEGLNIQHHSICPDWNYTVSPHTS